MTHRTRLRLPWPALLLLLAAITLPATVAAQAPPTPSPVSIQEIVVEPSNPGPDTLCRLKVKLANSGDQIASRLGFSVKLNGQELGVYSNQLFMFPVPAGGSADLQLFNFWTTETSRAMPADLKMRVEVSLLEAVWMNIEDDEEGVEVWTPLEDVPGLPTESSVTLEMKKAS